MTGGEKTMAETILVVDDSVADRLIISSALSEYTVLTACDGLDALRQLEGHPAVDLVVLDLNMPGMNGFQVLENLQDNGRLDALRVIILTHSDEQDNEVRGLEMGAVDYIRKPVQMASIKLRIDRHISLLRLQRLYEQRLHDQDLTFDVVFQQAPIGIAISWSDVSANDDGQARINPIFEQITGRSKEELIRLGWAAITHPDDLAEDQAHYQRFLAGETTSYAMDKRYIKPDGSIVWVYMVVAPLKLSRQLPYQHMCLIQDITRRKTMEKTLAENERSRSVLLSHLPGMAYRCCFDQARTLQYVSAGCLDLTGYTADQLNHNQARGLVSLIAPEYRDLIGKTWEQALSGKKPFRHEYEVITRTGMRKWVLEQGQGIFDDQGTLEALEGLILDISEQKRFEMNLKYNSEHDAWTGLYNRRSLEALLNKALHSSQNGKSALVGINLRAIQTLNMVYGFQYTWALVRKFSDMLNTFCDKDRQLFNLYDYYFAIYVRRYQDREELAEFCSIIAHRLRDQLTQERVNIGMGIVEMEPGVGLTVDHLMKSILIATEKAMEKSDDLAICFFDRDMEAAIVRKDEIKRELAIVAADPGNDQLYLQFQPIWNLHSGKVCSFEALARFRSQQYGLVSPLAFIPIAEETKLIIPLGYRIIEQSFRFLQTLQAYGHDDVSVSINISAIQLLGGDFTDNLQRMIREKGIDPESVNLEITESILAMNYQEINEILGRLQALGISIAIDDFGTGYSSLSRERELNVNCLKIDRSFIDKLMELEAGQAITGDIISMAHKLGHCVIAEGVEYLQQLRYLQDYQCDMIQGYLLSRPLDPDTALHQLQSKTFGFSE